MRKLIAQKRAVIVEEIVEEPYKKKSSEVMLTQYLRPYGTPRVMYADVGDEIAKLADNMILSCEELTTREIAVYARFQDEPEESEWCDLATNGPGDRDPTAVLISLIKRKDKER